MNNIKKELQEILVTNPNVVGAGYGKKVINNLITEEKCLSFGVKKKLPLNEVSPENLIPSEIEIDGVVYKTDVNELGEIKPMACSLPSTCYDCYDGSPYAVPCATNASTARPIKGGTVFQVPGGYGTLGFFAVHTPTQAIVAITNAHVVDILPYLNGVSGGPFTGAAYSLTNYTNRAPLGVPRTNQPFNRYNYTNFGMPAHIDKESAPPYVNNIDAAMVAVYQYDAGNVPFVTNAESWKQIGLSDIPGGVNTPPPFASTQELDALTDFTNLEVWSSGARTGVKKDGCSFKIVSDDYGFSMSIAGSITTAYYENTIQITRFDTSCLAINNGDSGSALMGKVPTYNPADPNWKNGARTWKILGLIYAGNGASSFSMGIACRIDHVAAKLQIEAWDGSPKPFLDIPNMDYKVLESVHLDASKTIDSKEYWQLGLIGKQSTIFS